MKQWAAALHGRHPQRKRGAWSLGTVIVCISILSASGIGRSAASEELHPTGVATGVNHTVPKVTPPARKLRFSAAPADGEFLRTGLFAEPLVPVSATASQENLDLAHALLTYRDSLQKSGDSDAVEPILAFLDTHPHSAWKAALQLDLGIVYRQTGHFSKALATWQEGWNETRELQDRSGHALANAMLARLSQLEAYLGRKELLQPLLDSTQDRPVGGTAAQLLTDS